MTLSQIRLIVEAGYVTENVQHVIDNVLDLAANCMVGLPCFGGDPFCVELSSRTLGMITACIIDVTDNDADRVDSLANYLYEQLKVLSECETYYQLIII